LSWQVYDASAPALLPRVLAVPGPNPFFYEDQTLHEGGTQHFDTTCRDLDIQRQFPEVKVLARRLADAGTIITAAGITAGIDMALQFVDRLQGEAVAKWTAHGIEYVYWPQGKSAV
jgi:hypothetical protein